MMTNPWLPIFLLFISGLNMGLTIRRPAVVGGRLPSMCVWVGMALMAIKDLAGLTDLPRFIVNLASLALLGAGLYLMQNRPAPHHNRGGSWMT